MPDDLDLRDLHGRHEPDPRFRLELRRQVEDIVRGAPPVPSTDPTDSTEPNEEDLIMLTDTRTEAPEAAKRSPRWILPAAIVALIAGVATIAIVARDDDSGTTVAGPPSTTLGSDVVFHDDFSDDSGLWETAPSDVTVESGQQVWTLRTPGQVEFLKPRIDAHDPLDDMKVTAAVASVDPDSTIGLYCRKGVGNQDSYYYFRLGPTGAVIGVVEPDVGDGTTQVLAEDDSFVRPDGPFELTASCSDYTSPSGPSQPPVAQLSLIVDGVQVIAAAHDAPLPAGYGALEVQAGAPGTAPSEVRWDELTVARL